MTSKRVDKNEMVWQCEHCNAIRADVKVPVQYNTKRHNLGATLCHNCGRYSKGATGTRKELQVRIYDHKKQDSKS